ncbi:DUF3857 domain-containing protein [uncultured Pontibacter sp.]|uniref:DUF3857 domain-containing protein n=1 Tax=uncultured Pontibacter sp. TaxID=453356 RepID=UPI00260ECCC6|nr:DUF3857 domain-containing protein [uncultured Pontibacter sp.]
MKLQTSTILAGLAMFFLIGTVSVSGQTYPVKFGKIDDSELTMRNYEQDTSAAAVVLSDVGYSYFTYNKGFRVIFERHTRIKVLKKSGYNAANVEIPFYQKGTNKEQVYSIKGFTYNLEGGKVTKDKLDSKAVFSEQTSENWHMKKFMMPNVKEGSIIEYSYTISSDFLYNLREWEFQSTIPVAHSEYKVRIPEYYDYKLLQQGYLNFNEANRERGKENFTVTWSSEIVPGIGGGRTSGGSSVVEAENTTYHWVVKNAPALRPESYITTLRDYQSKIEFELQSVKYPGQTVQMMTGNWDQVTKEMLDSDRFGAQLNRKGFFKNDIAAITAKYTKPEEQMATIYDMVKSTMKWNGKYGIYISGPLRKAYENRTGSAAEINLMLVAMLQEAGIDAAPVLVSTREHGRPPQEAPMLNKFNYVIAHVAIDGKDLLLDATDPLLQTGMLPVRSLNGQGRLIKQTDQRWVALQPIMSNMKLYNGIMTIDQSGGINGNITESRAGYNAFTLRKTLLDEGEESYAEKFSKEVGNYSVGKPVFNNVNILDKSLDINYSLTASGNSQPANVIYVNPMLGQGEKENPFKLETRLYPVDIAAPIDQTYICRFELPEGYVLEEAPQNAMISLPENGGRFMYVVQQEGSTVQVMSKIIMAKPVYYAQEYPYLKEFYTQIVAKHAEQIVLKKVANN